jgi:glutaredoxin
MASPIKVYALSTCIHCKHAKEFLDEQKFLMIACTWIS